MKVYIPSLSIRFCLRMQFCLVRERAHGVLENENWETRCDAPTQRTTSLHRDLIATVRMSLEAIVARILQIPKSESYAFCVLP